MSVKGWVYIITNRAMPGLVKVGYSMKDPTLRAAELNHTGNPHPYDVQYECLVRNPRDVEQATHGRLISYREGKEWFRCDIPAAIEEIRYVAGNSMFLENTFSGERSLLGQFKIRIQELEDQNALLQSKEYIFREAIDGDDLEWKRCIVRYPNWPAGLLAEFCREYDLSELEDALIENPSLDPETISQIVEDAPYGNVLKGALNNPACSAETLADIVWHSNFHLLALAENHKNFSSDTLHQLLGHYASDDDMDARAQVARFAQTPPQLLANLAADTTMEVRRSVAANPNCPLEQLYVLITDIFEEVVFAAEQNPNHPLNLAKKPECFGRLCLLLRAPSTPKRVLHQFVSHQKFELRQAIALNPACPEELLSVLANDPEIRVRIAAKHRIEK